MLSSRAFARRLTGAVIVVASPAAIALAVLVATEALALAPAALALAAVIGGLALLLARHLARLDRLGAELRALAEDRAGASGRGEAMPADLQRGTIEAALEAVRHRLADRRRELDALRASGAALLDGIPDALVVVDAERRITRANAAARGLFGDGLDGRDLATVVRDPSVLEAVDEVLAGVPSRSTAFVLAGAVERDLSVNIARLAATAPDGSAAVAALFDVTAIKRADQIRADFVANVSHELRTPLSTLLGFTETLRGAARDDEAARERFLGIMHEQALRMSRLVSDLLSLSKIEASEHTPPTGLVELGPLVAGVADALALQAQAKGVTVELKIADGLPPVVGDADQLAQVFQNLIDNAIKYGRPGSAVRIAAQTAARPSGQGARMPASPVAVAVVDEGEGIPREHLPRLTERFYRVDAGRSRQLGGTGLGLAIVKHIVNRHRGALTIDSEVGRGSAFTVYLPPASAGAARLAGVRSEANR